MMSLDKNKKIAIVGASNDPKKYGYKIIKHLSEKGFKNLYPINPNEQEILNFKVYSSLRNLSQKPDIINFVVPPNVTLNVLNEIKELGWDNVWFQPGSFDEQVIDKAKELGLNYVDGACIMVAAVRLGD